MSEMTLSAQNYVISQKRELLNWALVKVHKMQ